MRPEIKALIKRVEPFRPGEVLTLLRRHVAVDQKELARKLDVSQGYVSYMERTGNLNEAAEAWVKDMLRVHGQEALWAGVLLVIRKRARRKLRDLAIHLRVQHGYLVRVERDWRALGDDGKRSDRTLAAYADLAEASALARKGPGTRKNGGVLR